MTSLSEKSFGARFLQAQNLLNSIEGFSGYDPPGQTESVNGFAAFLQAIDQCNIKKSECMQQYKAAVRARQLAFREDDISIMKLLPRIKAAILAQYGRNSQQFKAVSSIIAQMRAVKFVPVSAAPNSSQEKSISQSQQSYGSLLGYFKDLVGALGQMSDYTSSNVALQTPNLLAFIATVDALNTAVTQKLQALREQRQQCLVYYDDLTTSVQKVKAYLRAHYGPKSYEYQSIQGIGV